MLSRRKKKALAAYLLLKRIHKRRRRMWWVHPINQRREKYGEFHKLCKELKSFPQRYIQHFRVINTTYSVTNTIDDQVGKLSNISFPNKTL
jgi:hypothetical protein